MVIILMGVSGSGKTTVGRLLSRELDWRFHDADDDHPPANIEKMGRGVALTEADRQPWLDALAQRIRQWIANREDVVIACSALTQHARQTLATEHPRGSTAPAVRFVHLKGSPEMIRERIEERFDHFMPEELLESQFATLEEPQPQESALEVSAAPDPASIVREIRQGLGV